MPVPDHILKALRDPPSETALIRMIQNFLITPSQTKTLSDMGLSIWDLLNGYYPADNQKVADIFRAWNETAGESIFFTWT